jgi:hypothetical protein
MGAKLDFNFFKDLFSFRGVLAKVQEVPASSLFIYLTYWDQGY